MEINKIAWGTLTEDEKSALTLQFGLNKSSWESGEILNRSHYKYLEIKYRATQFLKMFTEHLDKYERLIPAFIPGNPHIILYFQLCLEKRLKPMEAIKEIESPIKLTKGSINEKIIAQLRTWEKSENAHCKQILDLIKEYDRWNNFRILPKAIQEPSAYKRRVKNSYKKHIKVISQINPLSFKKLLKLYKTNRAPYLLMPILEDGEPEIHKVKNNKQSLKIINSIGLYLFKKPDDAQEYIDLVGGYVTKKKKECKDGLHFWPKYREIIKTAENYAAVQQITPTRRHLQLAIDKLEYL